MKSPQRGRSMRLVKGGPMIEIFVIYLLLNANAFAANSLTPQQIDRIANAIYRIEGGAGTKFPYGIKSVKFRNPAHARQICKQTIANNFKRWGAAGRPGVFLDFLANRYCPASCDPLGNKRWKANARRMLENF
jgi:hypothetical protein